MLSCLSFVVLYDICFVWFILLVLLETVCVCCCVILYIVFVIYFVVISYLFYIRLSIDVCGKVCGNCGKLSEIGGAV